MWHEGRNLFFTHSSHLSIGCPISALGQLAEPGFEAFLEGQECGNQSRLQWENIPKGRDHSRKGSFPTAYHLKFFGRWDLEYDFCWSEWDEPVPLGSMAPLILWTRGLKVMTEHPELDQELMLGMLSVLFPKVIFSLLYFISFQHLSILLIIRHLISAFLL